MIVASVIRGRLAALSLLLSASCLLSGLAGCRGADSDDKAPVAKTVQKPEATDPGETVDGVSLKPEETEKMGIVTSAAVASLHIPETTGFGVVVAHETIAQAVADLQTATAVERQSHAALVRGQRLAGTPGAMPLETQEGAQRQSVVDQAALELAKRRLTSTFGSAPPWKNHFESPELAELANGVSQLVHVTFPLGTIGEKVPESLRFSPINTTHSPKNWSSSEVWRAPADSGVPGTSLFAVLHRSGAAEGERLMAWAPIAQTAEEGVEIPASAAVISAGKYWCFIEEKPGLFVRTEIDSGTPTENGYFVKDRVKAGDKIVTASAGQLLARQSNPSTAAD